MAEDKQLSGPDLKSGVELDKLIENESFLGHWEGEAVVLMRQGDQVSAMATVPHLRRAAGGGASGRRHDPMSLHHARFNIHTGEAEGAPALNPLSCFHVRPQGNTVAIAGKMETDFRVACPQSPSSVVIIGAGVAGAA
jgi:nitrite reductase/ring-hydroxylating ferredoxin subunit